MAARVKRRHEVKAGPLTASAGERATAAAELRPHGVFSDTEQRRSRGHVAEAEAAQLHSQSSEEGPRRRFGDGNTSHSTADDQRRLALLPVDSAMQAQPNN